MNFLPKNVHEISFPLGGKIPPKLGRNFILTCAHEIDPRLDCFVRDTHSSLLGPFISYKENKV